MGVAHFLVALAWAIAVVAVWGWLVATHRKHVGKTALLTAFVLGVIFLGLDILMVRLKAEQERQPPPSVGEWLSPVTTYVQSMPWRWIALGLVGGFLLAVWLLRVLRQRAPAVEQIPAAEVETLKARIEEQAQEVASLKEAKSADAKKVERLEEIAKELNDRVKLKENLLGQYKWLHDVAGTQSMDIDEYVTLEKARLGDADLDYALPSIRFGLYITNHSVFEVTVELEGGHIEFEGHPLMYPVKVLYNDLKNARFGKKGCITLEQPLRNEEAELIKASLALPDACFYFDKLILRITADKHYPKVGPTRLIIPKQMRVSVGRPRTTAPTAAPQVTELNRYLADGKSLLQEAADGSVSFLSKRVADWEDKVGTYIAKHLCEYEKLRFLSDDDMEVYSPSEEYVRAPDSQRPDPLFLNRIYTRVVRLERLIETLH
jgi:hypothetical protein